MVRAQEAGVVREANKQPPGSHVSLSLLVTWVSFCATYLACARTFLPDKPQTLPQWALLTLLASFSGVCWTGLTLVVVSSCRSTRIVIEPGLWLTASIGLILLGDLIVGALPANFPLHRPAMSVACHCLAITWPTLSYRLDKRWKPVFTILATVEVIRLCSIFFAMRNQEDFLGRLPLTFSHLRGIVGLTAIAILILADHRATRLRNIHHWIGLGCAIAWLSGDLA